MMLLAFELSMPRNNSWNGKWSGECKPYVKIVNLGRTKKAEAKGNDIISNSPYYHDFGDGWAAMVSVREVDQAEAATFRRKSAGFCGFDWMVDNILEHRKIRVGG